MNIENPSNQAYSKRDWNNYAELFNAVTTFAQLRVYEEASKHLFGRVVDLGCGSAKIAPLLTNKHEVTAYTGVDLSKEMVAVARDNLTQHCPKSFVIKQSDISAVNDRYDSGVSIQSFYAWHEPENLLTHIFHILAPGARFVLASVNPELELKRLLTQAEKELVGHPCFPAFYKANMDLAKSSRRDNGANFVSLGIMVDKVQRAGFSLLEAHQHHFDGGLNFLVFGKEAVKG